MFFALASLGMPGTGNFVGEFLVLLGSYRVSVVLTVLATLGFVVAVVYALSLVQRTFHGENVRQWHLPDSSGREMAEMGAMALVAVWLGLYPQPVLDAAAPALGALQSFAERPVRHALAESAAYGLPAAAAASSPITDGE